MSKSDKLLVKMRNNPRDWHIQDIEKVAAYYGFEKRHHSGSHVTFSHAKLDQILTVPAHRPIKAVYVKKLLALIDEVSA